MPRLVAQILTRALSLTILAPVLAGAVSAQLSPLAKPGAGPGEARSIFAIGWSRDTLWTVDGILQRITYYSRDLALLRSQRIAERCGDRPPWAIMADGRCLVLDQRALPLSMPDPEHLAFPLTLVAKSRVDTLALWSVPRIRVRYADAETHVLQPFSDQPLFLWSTNGRYYAWIGRRPVQNSDHPRISIEFHDVLSPSSTRFEVPYTPQPLTATSVDSFLAGFRAPGPSGPGLTDSIRRRLYRPRFLPAIAQAILTEDAHIWIREQPDRGSPTVMWRAFSSTGIEAYRLALPVGVRLYSVTPHGLLGTVVDEDDVPHLVQYHLPVLH